MDFENKDKITSIVHNLMAEDTHEATHDNTPESIIELPYPSEYISEKTLSRLKLLSVRCRELNTAPKKIPYDIREELSLMFAITFKEFVEFAYVGMKFLGFSLTPMQRDMAYYMQHGGRLSMEMAQRGEAKSTLGVLYAVWCLMQNQTTRVLIVSATESLASEQAILVIRLIEQWHLFCWLKGDPSKGDRTSYEAYDVHYSLKGLDKSPSIACIGITASLNGKRADLLIADDVETNKNGHSPIEREKLLATTKDFSSICTHGQILYLGTPQSRNSIYNTLESRGFTVRIWCGRVPSLDLENRYGERLALFIKRKIQLGAAREGYGADGTRGEVTDPDRYSEHDLISKELDQGLEFFDLQYMLDTTASDDARTRIKLADLIIFDGNCDAAPDALHWTSDRRFLFPDVPESVRGTAMYLPLSIGSLVVPYSRKLMVVDPAGGGGDEVAFCAGGSCSSYIHVFNVGGLQGGVSTANIDYIIDKCIDLGIDELLIEKNMGHGTVTNLFINRIRERKIFNMTVSEVYNTQQKEKRIIDTISPVTRRHRLVIHSSAVYSDTACLDCYSRDRRGLYSLFKQMMDITYSRGSLSKDDRLDTLSMLVSELSNTLVVESEQAAKKAQDEDFAAFLANPLDMPEYFEVGNSEKYRARVSKDIRKREISSSAVEYYKSIAQRNEQNMRHKRIQNKVDRLNDALDFERRHF